MNAHEGAHALFAIAPHRQPISDSLRLNVTHLTPNFIIVIMETKPLLLAILVEKLKARLIKLAILFCSRVSARRVNLLAMDLFWHVCAH